VAGRPALTYALEEIRLAGLSRAIIILRQGKEIIRRCLEDETEAKRLFPDSGSELFRLAKGLSLTFLMQEEPLGECDAIALAREQTANRPFAVLYPDNIALRPGGLAYLLEEFTNNGKDTLALTALTPETAKATSNSGRVDLEPAGGGAYRVLRFLPKEPGCFTLRWPGELRTCGLYFALPHFYEFIELARKTLAPGQEITDGKVRRVMLAHGVEFLASELPAPMLDMGNPAGYSLATPLLLNR